MSSPTPSTMARELAERFVGGDLDSNFSQVGNFQFKSAPVFDPATGEVAYTTVTEDRRVVVRRFTKEEIAASGGAIRSEDQRVTLLLPSGDDGTRYTGASLLLDGEKGAFAIIDVVRRFGVGMVSLQVRR